MCDRRSPFVTHPWSPGTTRCPGILHPMKRLCNCHWGSASVLPHLTEDGAGETIGPTRALPLSPPRDVWLCGVLDVEGKFPQCGEVFLPMIAAVRRWGHDQIAHRDTVTSARDLAGAAPTSEDQLGDLSWPDIDGAADHSSRTIEPSPVVTVSVPNVSPALRNNAQRAFAGRGAHLVKLCRRGGKQSV